MTKQLITLPNLEEIRDALRNTKASTLDIYAETALTPSWQAAFKNGQIAEPSYTKMVDLIKFLKM